MIPGCAGFDARSEERTEGVFAAIGRDIGSLEVVVYNPGANVNFPIRETTSRAFRKVWEMAMKMTSIAEAYWNLHQQSRDAWTFELDLRPYAEHW